MLENNAFRNEVMAQLNKAMNGGDDSTPEPSSPPVSESSDSGDLSGIIKNIIEHKMSGKSIESGSNPQISKEVRADVIANIDWGVMDALFNK